MMYLFAYFVKCTFHALYGRDKSYENEYFYKVGNETKASVIFRKYGNSFCNSKLCITNTTSDISSLFILRVPWSQSQLTHNPNGLSLVFPEQ